MTLTLKFNNFNHFKDKEFVVVVRKASVPFVSWCWCLLPPGGRFANTWAQSLSASLHAATLTVWEMLSSFSTTRTFCMHLLSAPAAASTPPSSSSSCDSSPKRLLPSAPLLQGLWRRLTASSSRMASVKVHRRRSSLCPAPTGSACSIFFLHTTQIHNPIWQPAFFFFLHLPFAFQTFTTNALSGPVHRLFILEAGPPCCHWLLLCTAYLTLRATAVFICLPAIKNVAKAKPGGVVGRNKRGATLHEDSWEERSAHPALRHSSLTHFTAPLSACQRHIRPLTGYFKSVSSEERRKAEGKNTDPSVVLWVSCWMSSFII